MNTKEHKIKDGDGVVHNMWCQHCKTTQKQDLIRKYFYEAGNTQGYICRDCNNSYVKRSYHRNKLGFLGRQRRYIKDGKEKILARAAVRDAVSSGKIKKTKICSRCNKKPRTRIEAHHEDYSEKLSVVWVCKPCHYLLDNETV